MQNPSFPSRRQFYTSLIAAIAQPPKHTSSQKDDATPPSSNLSSPSPFSKDRRLLLTLHVLFPTLVLPALDLLDRKLITRFDTRGYRHRSEIEMGGGGGVPDDDEARREQLSIALYTVKSTVPPRRRDTKPVKRYVVHTRAWNCSCPSFALDAHHQVAAEDTPPREGTTDEDAPRFGFGGLGQDGGSSWNDVPCCKHLLACFLVESGEGMLDGHVETVAATKEEMAAMVASL